MLLTVLVDSAQAVILVLIMTDKIVLIMIVQHLPVLVAHHSEDLIHLVVLMINKKKPRRLTGLFCLYVLRFLFLHIS